MKVSIMHIAALVGTLAGQANAYDCWRRTDNAARWNDALSPADRLVDLCKNGGPGERCHQASTGRMCVNGPGNEGFCNFIWGWAGSAQSWHGDWFLWGDIECDGGVAGFDDDIFIGVG